MEGVPCARPRAAVCCVGAVVARVGRGGACLQKRKRATRTGQESFLTSLDRKHEWVTFAAGSADKIGCVACGPCAMQIRCFARSYRRRVPTLRRAFEVFPIVLLSKIVKLDCTATFSVLRTRSPCLESMRLENAAKAKVQIT
jgi:hypothetical protein